MANSEINLGSDNGTAGKLLLLAESTGSKTYKEHLDALYSAYSSLTQNERKRTIIANGDMTFYNYGSSVANGAYVVNAVAENLGKINCYTMRIRNNDSSYVEAQLKLPINSNENITLNSKTNHSAETYDGTIQLLLAL